jgi:para-nitrobenzyl esterase
MPYWFGTLDAYNMLRPTRAWTAYDRDLSDKMMGALIALAETSSPSTKAMTWPAWTPAHEQKIEFGDKVSLVDLNLKRMDWLAAHPAARFNDGRPQNNGPRD